MSWVIYAFACAFFASAAAIVQKKTLHKQHAMEFSASVALLNLLISLPLFFFIDYSNLQFWPLVIVFFVSILAAIAFLLISKSVRHMEISSASPLLVLGPGITAVLAFLLLGEKLTLLQSTGIAILIFGSYVLELKNHHDLFHPLRVLKQSKYVYFIILALFLYALCGVNDRLILSRFGMEPITYLAFAHVFLAFHFLVMMTIFYGGFKDIKNGIRNAQPWIFIAAIFIVSYRFAQIHAVSIAYVGLVLPIKRMSALITTIVGGELFKEHNLMRKSIACVIMVLGVVLIVI